MLNSQVSNSSKLRDFYLNQLENTKNPIQVEAILNTLDLINHAEIHASDNTAQAASAEQA